MVTSQKESGRDVVKARAGDIIGGLAERKGRAKKGRRDDAFYAKKQTPIQLSC
jgi:hypothetical protein